MKAYIATTLLFAALGIAPALSQDAIPARPEKLKYPPLVYEPPDPATFRVPLKSGPIAYVVPDHELPLVNIVVLAHTGEYVEPAGKEGLAELTGYLLARGGTKSRTAEALEDAERDEGRGRPGQAAQHGAGDEQDE